MGSFDFSFPIELVSAGDVVLDLNSYPEKVILDEPDNRLTRRNSVPKQRRLDIAKDAVARIRSAKIEAMVCISIRKIETGNATGLRLIIKNISRGFSTTHCVQICVFPTCLCKDFMTGSRRSSIISHASTCTGVLKGYVKGI